MEERFFVAPKKVEVIKRTTFPRTGPHGRHGVTDDDGDGLGCSSG